MRAVGLVLITLVLQSVLGGVLPDTVSPPDLWFLLALALASHLPPAAGLVAAFGLGLFQDLASAGYPGLHAMGLLTAVYAFYGVGTWLHWEEVMARGMIVFLSFLAKWLGYLIVVYWLRFEVLSPLTFAQVFVPELILTLGIGPLYLRFAQMLVAPRYEEHHA